MLEHSDFVERQSQVENLLKRRFFIAPAFEIYGSTAGLFDFGSAGCALKNEFEKLWRQFFVYEDDLMEICGPSITPKAVLVASGHVERFLDLTIQDSVTREFYRADKILTELLEKIEPQTPEIALDVVMLESMTIEQIKELIAKYNLKTPAGNTFTDPVPFNLMFSSTIGPRATEDDSTTVYLRPETAQGIFVNFKRMLEQNGGKLPFGGACVGTAYRNEISPRNGLLRVREFPMAEVEYFVDPEKKNQCPKFESIANVQIYVFDRATQLAGIPPSLMTIREAVESKLIDNLTLGYFIGRTYLFLMAVGINPEGLRFRQHLSTEMAHYASDCWDAEILCSYKWIECVGIADRSAYDLTKHSQATKVDLVASRPLGEVLEYNKLICVPNKKMIGPKMKQDAGIVLAALENLETTEVYAEKMTDQGSFELEAQGQTFTITPDLCEFQEITVKKTEDVFTPSVIEPSFGIGRILQALFEHSFRVRSEERTYFAFSPRIAPYKAAILPISNRPEFEQCIETIRRGIRLKGLQTRVDASNASIGKRYARTDELGVPFCITIDMQTVIDESVTMREIESTSQVRLPVADVADTVSKLVSGCISWDEVKKAYPLFVEQELV